MADEARSQRAEARERRRLTSKPFEELDEAAGRRPGSTPMAAVKRAAGTAAAAALAGALAGAVKALRDRRVREAKQHAEPETEDRATEEPEAEQEVQPEEPSETRDETDDVTDEAPPQQDTPPQPETEAEPEQDEPLRHQNSGDGVRGASPGDALEIVKQARTQLRELLGIEAESVSGVQRSNGAWHVTLEAVEVHRIPDSTDVLSSYEVVLDNDGGVVSMARTRRYRRSQVEED